MLNPWNVPLIARVICCLSSKNRMTKEPKGFASSFGSSVLWLFDFSLVHFANVLQVDRLIADLDRVATFAVVFGIDFDRDAADGAGDVLVVGPERGDCLADQAAGGRQALLGLQCL